MDETKNPGLQISQIFLLRAEFGHREDALSLPANTREGEQRVGINVQFREHNEGRAASVWLRVSSDPEATTALYRYSVEMVGVVEATPGEENLPPREYIVKAGVTLLFPFVRETLANLTMRGRFGPLWIKPFNVQAAVDDETRATNALPPSGATAQENG